MCTKCAFRKRTNDKIITNYSETATTRLGKRELRRVIGQFWSVVSTQLWSCGVDVRTFGTLLSSLVCSRNHIVTDHTNNINRFHIVLRKKKFN